MAYTLVIYDISDDDVRRKAADICLGNGLDRIQRSAYAGRIPRLTRKNLISRLKSLNLGIDDSIMVLVVSDEEYAGATWIKYEGRLSRKLFEH